jgi:hypothetical protein
MNSNLFARILTVIFFIVVINACSNKEEYPTPESVIEANVKYMNEEKFDEAMNTIYKDSPSYPASEIMIKQIFERYDLNYKIVSMKVVEENDSDAKVEFVQVTTKLKGTDFKNNRATGIHTLKKDGDSWKIYGTEMTDIQFLN